MKKIKILHLYPNLMNLYGDYGNVLVLKKHLEDLKYKVTIDEKTIENNFDINDYDFIYMGSGKESSASLALENLIKHKKQLQTAIKKNKVILFTGNALELLGNKYGKQKGLGIFDFDVELTDKRYTGDVIVDNEQVGEVIGFINKCSIIKNDLDTNKLFVYEFKDKNVVDNSLEGYRLNNMFATHIIGPVLAKNPSFINLIVELLVKGDYKEIEYPYEKQSYEVTLNALKKRK